MERESEHKSSTTVRNQNNHVRPPIRRRKKKAPLPPNITDDSISLAGDSANESLVQVCIIPSHKHTDNVKRHRLCSLTQSGSAEVD